MNDEMRNMLAQYLQQRNKTLPDAAPPQGPDQEDWNLPQMSMQGGARGAPAVRGEYSQDGVTLRGNFHRPNPQDRPVWGAQIGYRKQF